MQMRGSDDFIFSCVNLLYYKCHKITFKHGGFYIDFSVWIKKEKATINPKNDDNKCFKYAVTFALNNRKTESHSQRVSNIKLFINNYN